MDLGMPLLWQNARHTKGELAVDDENRGARRAAAAEAERSRRARGGGCGSGSQQYATRRHDPPRQCNRARCALLYPVLQWNAVDLSAVDS